MSPKSARIMEVRPTEPGLQVYSGNVLESKIPREWHSGKIVYKFTTDKGAKKAAKK